MKDINCPYCNEQLGIDHEDGYGYEEDMVHEQECENCNKLFVYETSISFNYEASQADCLNGGDHKYKPTMTNPRRYTKMVCQVCDNKRECTDSEMKIVMDKDK